MVMGVAGDVAAPEVAEPAPTAANARLPRHTGRRIAARTLTSPCRRHSLFCPPIHEPVEWHECATKAAVERAHSLIERAEALGEPAEDPLLLFAVLVFYLATPSPHGQLR